MSAKIKSVTMRNGVPVGTSSAFKVIGRKPTALRGFSSGFNVGKDHCFIVAPTAAALSRILKSGHYIQENFHPDNFQQISISSAKAAREAKQ